MFIIIFSISNFVLTYFQDYKTYLIVFTIFFLGYLFYSLKNGLNYIKVILFLLSFFLPLVSTYFYNMKNFEPGQRNYILTGTIVRQESLDKYDFIDVNKNKYILVYSGELFVGDEVYVLGKSKNIKKVEKKFSNIFEFDYEKWLFMKGYTSQIFAQKVVFLRKGKLSFYHKYKGDIVSTIKNNLGNGAASGLFLGMIIGDKTLLDDKLNEKFRLSGLSHILVVSGGNIVLLVGFLSAILFFIPYYFRIFIIMGFIIIYCFICGFDSSVLRAGIMGLLGLIIILFGRNTDNLLILKYSFIGMLLYNPYYLVYDVGFLLSFSAIIGIIFSSNIVRKIGFKNVFCKYFLNDIFSPTLGAILGTLPIVLLYFGTLNLASVFANILVSPIIGFYMLQGFLNTILIKFIGTDLLLFLNNFLSNYIYFVADFFSKYGLFIKTGVIYSKITLVIFIYLLVNYFVSKIGKD